MDKSKWMLLLAFTAGVVLASRVRALPVVGSKIPTL